MAQLTSSSKVSFLPGIILSVMLLAANTSSVANTLDAAEIAHFIEEMAVTHDFDANNLHRLFTEAQYSQRVLQAISKPAESLPWYQYRNIFLKEKRIRQGATFWDTHTDELREAERVYGVAPQIIVAIIGVETYYGQQQGKDRIIDALATLAFHYPKRAAFFRRELEQFLLLGREQNIDILILKGSYAGAMGIPQFISSSYRNYAVDFNFDGKKDLWNDPADAIGSVANYLHRHGWRRDEKVTFPLENGNEQFSVLANGGLKPHITVGAINKLGVPTQKHGIAENALLTMIELESEDETEYWLGLQNFYAITRYNHSALYAMAVYQLSQAIKQLHEKKSLVGD